jgi:hypothetical protein
MTCLTVTATGLTSAALGGVSSAAARGRLP